MESFVNPKSGMDLKNMEVLKKEEAKLELEHKFELRQIQSEILTEAVNLNSNGDDDEASRSKRMKRDNEQEEQDPVLMNSADHSTKRVNIFIETVAAQVGRNPMVVDIILKMMNTSDVWRNCRLVNLKWCDLSTCVLIKRKSLNVSLARESKSPPYQHQQQQHFASARGKNLKLSQLTNLVMPQWNSRYEYRFPCVNFAFDGDLNCADAQEFLDTHGKNIKGLKLSEKSDLEWIRKLLVEQVRSLESLELDGFETDQDGILCPEPDQNLDPSQYPPKIQLPSLTCFKIDGSFGCPESLIQEIVEIAPNLQKCKGIWQAAQIQPFLPRIHMFKEVAFNGDHLEFWESAIEENVQVEILYLDYFEVDFGIPGILERKEMALKCDGISSKLLQANQMTLNKIDFRHSRESHCHIKWPELKMVKELVIKGTLSHDENDEDEEEDEEEEEDGALKCPALEISQHFPNLKILSICSVDTTKSVQIFNGELLSLNSLTIYEQPELFNHCYKTFPNVTHLSLCDLKDDKFPRIVPNIWTMKHLRLLELELRLSKCSVEELDAVFTGMQKNTCEFLRTLNSKKKEFEDSEVDKLRVRPSILNLTELEYLVLHGKPKEQQQQQQQKTHDDENDIQIQIQTGGEKVKSHWPSFVSFEFAFNLMPKLLVSQRHFVRYSV